MKSPGTGKSGVGEVPVWDLWKAARIRTCGMEEDAFQARAATRLRR